MYQLSIVIEKDEFGYYAYCPALPGCHTQGDSLEEVKNCRFKNEVHHLGEPS
jgi:predicted RNase H-like HicB family nuclease